MALYNIVVNHVKKTDNKVLCLARIDNYRNMLKHVSIGESITSEPININFHNSVGDSKWELIYFPKGQYIPSRNSTILGNGTASIYLKMKCCENQHESLMTTVKFFIKSPYSGMKDKFPCQRNATFSYHDLHKRWTGPFNLMHLEELHSKDCAYYFVNDCLTIGCEMIVSTFSARITRSRNCLPYGNVDIESQKSTNTRPTSTKHGERQLQDNIEEHKEKHPRYRQSCSDFLSSAKEQKQEKLLEKPLYGYPQLLNWYGNYQRRNSGQERETWHQRLSTNKRVKMTNNENELPNGQPNVRSREAATTNSVLQVSNNNSGCVWPIILSR